MILLLGTNYINDHFFDIQTAEILGGGLSLDAMLHKLEGMAIQSNSHSYVFIDAINESVYKNVWKAGLSSLFEKVLQYPHIKLVISVRSGYEKLVFDDVLRADIDDGKVACLMHNGFKEESIEATMTFLNHYGIPFSPSYFLQTEMTNPLFLTLFCENYSQENIDMFSLFDRLINKSDVEAQASVGIFDQLPLLGDFVDEMAEVRLKTGTHIIARSALFDFKFWDRYGLSAKKIAFVASLERSGLLISTVYDDDEAYSLGYNLLEDFVCAKRIIKRYKNKDELVSYFLDELLHVKNGTIANYHNIDVFIVACGLYADRYHEECFPDVEKYVTDEMDKGDISKRYLESFIWRTAASVDEKAFILFLSEHLVDKEIFFRVLVENSTKENHPLNSCFLHKFLINRKLADRDVLWTAFANRLVAEDERVFQLISYFDEGNMLDGLSKSNMELLLILFTWLLTSSNRFLRDKASKAAIELLKCEFSLCLSLLQRFQDIDDPYVKQRLFGIIFGACVKRKKEEKKVFKDLVVYIYNSVFDQEYIYPDILLRDYARLIVERWIYEYPDEWEFILLEKITPPYKSEGIPIVEKQEYFDINSSNRGLNRIDLSMRIDHSDCPGLYGDFGRYIFQSALKSFENLDVVNLYHYAMQFIRDELGYNEQLGEVDLSVGYYRYGRHETRKVERIGKKYQWIAFYNILARVSDAYRISVWGEDSQLYQGPWEPYVRDFDPTLNRNFLKSSDIPTFDGEIEEIDFLPHEPSPLTEEIQFWVENKPMCFKTIPSRLLVRDTCGCDWLLLHLYHNEEHKPDPLESHSLGISKGNQKVWFVAKAFFVKDTNVDSVIEYVRTTEFPNGDFPEISSVYQLFNREYSWSPGYKNIFEHEWKEIEIESDQYHIETEILKVPDFEHITYKDDGNIEVPFVEKRIERKVPENVTCVKVLPSFSRVLWEEEYDASQDETTAFYVPCGSIINQLQLEQKESEGHFYSKDNELVCFDGQIDGLCDGLYIRLDYLKKYLQEQEVRLIWTCIGEKQYFLGGYNQQWANWKGVFLFENDEIYGEFERYQFEN